jgi:hypothetical protein
MTAAMLRFQAGRDPLNNDITALVGERTYSVEDNSRSVDKLALLASWTATQEVSRQPHHGAGVHSPTST